MQWIEYKQIIYAWIYAAGGSIPALDLDPNTQYN